MLSEFTAHSVYVGQEEGVLMVGLADEADQTRDYVLFQRTQEPGKQDLALGHDQIHWTLGNQAYSGYGGVEKVELSANRLEITFSSEAVDSVGVDRHVVVELAVTDTDLKSLTAGLQQLMPDIFRQEQR
jgi:hypothetical protein